MTPTLSICIPTYNRAPFLDALLTSIASQDVDFGLVEVVVSDNASTDDTRQIATQHQDQGLPVRYFCNETNEGADRNYLHSVERATGTYCWLMGSDDALAPGALAAIIARVASGNAIYLCDRAECDVDLNSPRFRHWLTETDDGAAFCLADSQEAQDYYSRCISIGAIFSYLSSIILKRQPWLDAPYDESYTGTLYSHVHKLLSFAPDDHTIEYIKQPLVLCRGGNDSFLGDGQFRRFYVDLDGYLKLADDHFSHDLALRRSFLDVLCRGHHLFSLKMRVKCSARQPWRELRAKMIACGFPRRLILLCDLVGPIKWPLRIPVWCIEFLRRRGRIT